MTLAKLSRRTRSIIGAFLVLWTRPTPRPALALPPDLAAAIEAARLARERHDTRKLHDARQRAYQARHEAMRRIYQEEWH